MALHTNSFAVRRRLSIWFGNDLHGSMTLSHSSLLMGWVAGCITWLDFSWGVVGGISDMGSYEDELMTSGHALLRGLLGLFGRTNSISILGLSEEHIAFPFLSKNDRLQC